MYYVINVNSLLGADGACRLECSHAISVVRYLQLFTFLFFRRGLAVYLCSTLQQQSIHCASRKTIKTINLRENINTFKTIIDKNFLLDTLSDNQKLY